MEINRKLLRKNARNALKGIYWFMFLFCLLAGMFGVTVGPRLNVSLRTPIRMAVGNYAAGELPEIEGTDGYNADADLDDIDDIFDKFEDELTDPEERIMTGTKAIVLIIFGIIFLFALLISLFAGIFLVNPLMVSFGKLKISAVVNRNADANDAFFAFKNGYFNIVKGMLLKNILVFLWSLLLVVPGIIKSYSYMMVPYILAENPNMKPREAIKLSRDMMKGFKWQTFVLQLSFFGWYILGALLCGVGILFVNPYYHAAETLLYSELKAYHASLTAKAEARPAAGSAAISEPQTDEARIGEAPAEEVPAEETETVEITDVEIVGGEAENTPPSGEEGKEEQ